MRLIIIGFGILVLLIGGLLAAPSFIDISKYKDQGLAQVKALSGYDVAIDGAFSFGVLPSPHVKAENVRIVNPAVSAEPFAAFEALSVSVALMPLLSQRVEVSEIALVRPDIRLATDASGKGNWLSPQVEALLGAPKSGEASAGGAGPDVAFDQVKIQSGSFRFNDAALSDIDLRVKAGSLQGPFEANGDLVFGEQEVAFDAKSGVMGDGPLALNANARYGDIDVRFEGAVDLTGQAVQGDVVIEAPQGEVEGAIVANAQTVDLSNATIAAMGQQVRGDVSVNLKPMKVTAVLSSDEIVDLDEILPKGQGGESAGLDPVLNALPKAVSVPVEIDADVKLSLSGIVFNGEMIRDVGFEIAKTGTDIDAEVFANALPGVGKGVLKAAIGFGDVSSSASGAQVYSDPVLNLDVSAEAQNVAALAAAFSGKSDLPVVSAAKVGSLAAKALVRPGVIKVEDLIVNLDGAAYQARATLRDKDGMADIEAEVFGADIALSLDKVALVEKPFAVSVKHDSLAGLMKAAGMAAPDMAELRKPLAFKADIAMDGANTRISNIDAMMLGSSVTGTMGVNAGGAKPSVGGNLRFGDLKLSAPAKSAGGASGDIDTGFLRVVDADVKVAAGSFSFDKWDLDAPSLHVVLKDGALDVRDVKAGVFGGQLAARANVAAKDEAAPLAIASEARITNVNLGALVSALSGSDAMKADGTVNFSYDINAAGKNADAIKGGLNGSAALRGRNIVVQGFDLVAVSNAVENDNRESILAAVRSFQSGSTAFETVTGDYAIADGIVSIEIMAMEGAAASIASSGSVDLPAGTLDTQHTVSFNQTDKLDPYTFSIRGGLDKPVSTFASIGQDALRGIAGKFVQEKAQELLGGTSFGDKLQQFGILPGQRQQATEPAANDNAVPVQEQQEQGDPAEEAIRGVLRGLLQ